MNQKYILAALCTILSISPAISASVQATNQNDSLKKILSFINKQTNQTSPVFDLLAKPRFEHVNAAIDRIIQRATDDQALANNPNESTSQNSIIITAVSFLPSKSPQYISASLSSNTVGPL